MRAPLLALLLGTLLVLLSGTVRSQTERVPGETWQRYALPEDGGFSSVGLERVRQRMQAHDSAALVIVHDGVVVAAWGDVDRRFMTHSIRQSLLSLLFGTHVADGGIDLDATLEELALDDVQGLTPVERRARIADLLTGRSGVYHPAAYEPDALAQQRPARGAHEPGTTWWPNNWDVNALLTIFETRTGAHIFEEFDTRLATPLQLQDWRLRDGYYHREPDSSRHAAYPFRMSARDLARIGLLAERGGRWGGTTIVPADWMADSTARHTDAHGDEGYGYMWWVSGHERLADLGMVSALGAGGQAIDVLPDADLVIVHLVDTWAGQQVDERERLELIELILDARLSAPIEAPNLVPLPDPAPEPAAALTPERLQALAGTYSFPIGITLDVRSEDDRLVLDMGRQGGAFDLRAISDQEFVVEDVGLRAFFDGPPDRPELILEPVHCASGEMQRAMGQLDEAIVTYSQVVSLFPKSTTAYVGLGQAYAEQGDIDAAIECFRQCLALEPDHAGALEHIAALEEQRSRG